MHNDIFEKISEKLPKSGRRVVNVCGLGGSGKSRFCKSAASTIGGVVVSTDWYLKYSSVERRGRIHDATESGDIEAREADENPINWYSWDVFGTDIRNLKVTGQLQLNNAWNQASGDKDLSINLDAQENSIIWCDGIYMLHPDVSQSADLTVFLEVSSDVARKRAEERDSHRSSAEYLASKIALMNKYDLHYFKRYSNEADVVINNTDFLHPKLLRC
jgi:uridine kinase